MKGYDIILNEGETLFMPSGYWHYMVYIDGGFAVSYRKIAQNIFIVLNGFGNLIYRLWIDKFMDSILGNKWNDFKIKIAFKRASHKIRRIKN